MSELSDTAARLLALAEAVPPYSRWYNEQGVGAAIEDGRLIAACDPQTISILCKAVVELERDAETTQLLRVAIDARVGRE